MLYPNDYFEKLDLDDILSYGYVRLKIYVEATSSRKIILFVNGTFWIRRFVCDVKVRFIPIISGGTVVTFRCI